MKNLLMAAALALIAIVAIACSTTSEMTPDELVRFDELSTEIADEDPAVAAAAQAELDALNTSVAERAVGSFIKWLDPYIPIPLEVFSGLIATLAFPRVRRTAIKTIKAAGSVVMGTVPKLLKGEFGEATAALGEFAMATGSIVGWADSRNATSADMQTWADELRAAGNVSMADLVEARITEIKAEDPAA